MMDQRLYLAYHYYIYQTEDNTPWCAGCKTGRKQGKLGIDSSPRDPISIAKEIRRGVRTVVVVVRTGVTTVREVVVGPGDRGR